jgi:hypothetical protein
MKLRNKKTGEIFDAIIREKGGGGSYSLIVCDIKAYEQSKSTLDATHSILGEYDTLAKFNEDWEDYKPAEPLIKDEKVRKVFRKWVGLYGAERFRVDHFCDAKMTLFKSTDLITEPLIELPGYIGEDSEIYTIEELCGEEE